VLILGGVIISGYVNKTSVNKTISSSILGSKSSDKFDAVESTPNITYQPVLDQNNISDSFRPDRFEFEKLNIKAPIQYAKLNDVFEQDKNGIIDTSKPIKEDLSNGVLSTPVQRLLTKGIVHLPYTPNPGEVGNSYIVGHSSNYSSVKSDYNYIFKDLNKAKTGDEFSLTDSDNGKKISFKVFEIEEIDGKDIEKAYKKFNDKKVVTLQASILVDGKPLKRLLVRGQAT
jgi:LPXTG-site transpeptidase (sortase) family protein